MAYEVNAPYIKYLNIKNIVKGYLILPRNVPHSLITITSLNIFMDIFDKYRLKESGLKYLGRSAGGASKSSTARVMVIIYNTMNLILRETM